MIKYIRSSLNESKSALKQAYIHNTPVNLVHNFTNDIDFNAVLQKIERLMYKDSAIYISPEQDDAADLLDDVIHEIAHSLEKEYEDLIYGDGRLAREFLAKRRSLFYLVDKPKLSMLNYNNANYSAKFDDHIYKDLGYDYLRNVSSGLFYSPYAITSLREYWANGFENYLLGDKNMLKDLSPVLYSKVIELIEQSEDY